MNEPLKNKIESTLELLKYTQYNKLPNKVFRFDDIESAVLWLKYMLNPVHLKNKLDKEGMEDYDYMYKDLVDIIDLAFADVVKE